MISIVHRINDLWLDYRSHQLTTRTGASGSHVGAGRDVIFNQEGRSVNPCDYVYSQIIQNPDGAKSDPRPLRDIPTQQDSRLPSTQPGPRFFQDAYKPDLRHGIFNAVGRDQTWNVYYLANPIVEENATLEKLSRATGAGHASGNHKPCPPGTRTEVIAEIERWGVDHNDRSVFWLKGVLGCGSSTIAQTFAERSVESGRLVASFFCSRDSKDPREKTKDESSTKSNKFLKQGEPRSNLKLILPTLAHDLASQNPPFRTALVNIIRPNPNMQHDSLDSQFRKLLIEPLKSIGKLHVIFIIDSLDECVDKKLVSEFLSALAQHEDEIPFVKFFITSKPEDHIWDGFALLRTRVLSLHDVPSDTVNSEIELYVKSQLQAIAMKRRHEFKGPWPLDKDVTAIVKKCSGFFIFASAIINFIDYRHEMPQDRLHLIVSMPMIMTYEGRSRMDDKYYQMLKANFEDAGNLFFDQLRRVVASIILAFDPPSRAILAELLGMSCERIWMLLSSLHSVLIIPECSTQPIRTYHRSFAGFLTDAQRCQHDARFHIDPRAHHLYFGVCCLNLMKTTLGTNICDLPRSVAAALAYACEWWANHLRSSAGFQNDTEAIVKLVDAFFENQFLSWLEVLRTKSSLHVAVYSLRDIKLWLIAFTPRNPPSSLWNLIDNYERLVLQFFDVPEGSMTHIDHPTLPLSPTASLMGTSYGMQMTVEVKLVNTIDANWDACLPFHRCPGTIAFSHMGDSLAIVSGEYVTIIDTVKAGPYFEGHRFTSLVDSICFSPDNNMLVCGLRDQSVGVWDTQKSHMDQVFIGHTGTVRSVTFSHCGIMVASGSDDKTIRIWDISSGLHKCMLEGHEREVLAVCWSGTGVRVISGSVDATVRVWDVQNQTCLRVIIEHTLGVTCVVAFKSPDSFLAASGSWDGTVKLYDTHSGRVIQTISTGSSAVESVRFSTHGDKIMCTNSGSVTVWDLGRNIIVKTIDCGGHCVAISPDGSLVASTHVASRIIR